MNISVDEAGESIGAERADPILASGSAVIERLPALRSIFDRTALEFSQRLGRVVEAPIELRVIALSARRLGEIQARFQTMKLGAVFQSDELETKIMLTADRAFINSLTEMFFGGSGFGSEQDTSRSVSSIEKRTANFAFELLASALGDSLADLIESNLRLEAIQSTIDLSALGNKSSVAVICNCSLHAFGQAGEIAILMPHASLYPLRGALSLDPTDQGSVHDERWTEILRESVFQTEVKISAIMDRKGLTLDDIVDFEVGQIIELAPSPTSLIKLECKGRTLFWSELGQKDGFYTVRIADFVDEDEEFIRNLVGD